jgi:hypothetical protein
MRRKNSSRIRKQEVGFLLSEAPGSFPLFSIEEKAKAKERKRERERHRERRVRMRGD